MSKKNLLNLRRGGALVMTALSAIFMLGMTALVTDVGYLYYSQSRLQTAVNAGWKAGYDRMLEIVKGGYAPVTGSTQDTAIRAHISEVMQKNGIATAGLKSLVISYTPLVPRQFPGYYLRVEATQNIGLFFAKIINFATSDVYAVRENHPNDIGQGVVPLAVPHGDVVDESRNTFGFHEFVDNEGFVDGKEYILKLGSGGGTTKTKVKTDPEGIVEEDLLTFIYIPMRNEYLTAVATAVPVLTVGTTFPDVSQSETGYLAAYGAIYNCLRHPGNPSGNVPVYWLLGYNGGAFLLYDALALRTLLNSKGVNYAVINDVDAAALISAAPDHKMLFNQPRIGIHTNSATPATTGIASLMVAAGVRLISQVDGAGDTNIVTDDEIISAGLSGFDILLMTDEDMTGYGGGCSHHALPCTNFLYSAAFGETAANKIVESAQMMCPRCREDFDIDTKLWKVGITPGADCELLGTRCAERQHVGVNKQGNPALFIWGEATNQGVPVNPILICGTAAQTQCADFIKRSKILGDVAPSFINQFAQKKKWQVAVKILDHVEGGGHLFAQGFAAETLDLALWQMNGMISFQDCLAFSGMAIADFPKRFPYIRFSNINCTAADVSAALTISNIYDARSQNHIGNPTTEPSNTNAFARTFADTATFLDLSNGDYAKYLKGAAGNGEYCYLAGTANSVPAKRLILNNILYASLSDKAAKYFVVARQKGGNYGPIDPDNYVGGGANDYRDRFMYGFDQPLQLWDRVIGESGNMRGPTDQSVDFRLDPNNPASRFIIVPITDIPPEVYDDQPVDTPYSLSGKDHPDGEYTPDVASFSASVRIIGFAMFELVDAKSSSADDIGDYQAGQVRGKFVKYVIDPREVEGMDPYVPTP
ncbi:MAG: hypothetical protein CVV41_05085 [Candidatus Riflebacteria bacterium HGW-Riflebacteria-1]|jgi:hypothetical protein|nr:MAG: hypothetical protein CVV41_05085 [Candidatus Riflebacteria bacterium HGW-Riflebacteria-1]